MVRPLWKKDKGFDRDYVKPGTLPQPVYCSYKCMPDSVIQRDYIDWRLSSPGYTSYEYNCNGTAKTRLPRRLCSIIEEDLKVTLKQPNKIKGCVLVDEKTDEPLSSDASRHAKTTVQEIAVVHHERSVVKLTNKKCEVYSVFYVGPCRYPHRVRLAVGVLIYDPIGIEYTAVQDYYLIKFTDPVIVISGKRGRFHLILSDAGMKAPIYRPPEIKYIVTIKGSRCPTVGSPTLTTPTVGYAPNEVELMLPVNRVYGAAITSSKREQFIVNDKETLLHVSEIYRDIGDDFKILPNPLYDGNEELSVQMKYSDYLLCLKSLELTDPDVPPKFIAILEEYLEYLVDGDPNIDPIEWKDSIFDLY